MGKKLPQDIGAFFDAHCTMLLPVQFCNLNFCILDLPQTLFVLCFCNKLCLYFVFCHKLCLYFVFATNFVCILFLQQTLFLFCISKKLCLYFVSVPVRMIPEEEQANSGLIHWLSQNWNDVSQNSFRGMYVRGIS